MLNLLRFGVPPNGRVQIGLDRLLALLLDLPGIDEVIPLPKMPNGDDPLTRAPWPIDRPLVRGLLGA